MPVEYRMCAPQLISQGTEVSASTSTYSLTLTLTLTP